MAARRAAARCQRRRVDSDLRQQRRQGQHEAAGTAVARVRRRSSRRKYVKPTRSTRKLPAAAAVATKKAPPAAVPAATPKQPLLLGGVRRVKRVALVGEREIERGRVWVSESGGQVRVS